MSVSLECIHKGKRDLATHLKGRKNASTLSSQFNLWPRVDVSFFASFLIFLYLPPSLYLYIMLSLILSLKDIILFFCFLKHFSYIGFFCLCLSLCLISFVPRHLCGRFLLSMIPCLWIVLSTSLYRLRFSYFPVSISLCYWARIPLSSFLVSTFL